jgi:signal transduction histidine kinase
MLKITWRKKLFIFAVIVALIPIAISSGNMIGITRVELKSNVNDELLSTAGQLAGEINGLYSNNWLAPLLLIKSGVESEALGANEKATLLSAGIENIEDIVFLTLYFEVKPGVYLKAVETFKESFKKQINDQKSVQSNILEVSSDEIDELKKAKQSIGKPVYVEAVDTWLVSMIVPVNIVGAPAGFLAARIRLNNLRERIQNHPFTKSGRILLIDGEGKEMFDPQRRDLSSLKVIQEAKDLLKSGSRVQGVTNYVAPQGERVVACYAYPQNLEWVVIAEIVENKAYLAVAKMLKSLTLWVGVGLLLAVLGVSVFSRQISQPIVKMREAAEQISSGNFDVDVAYRAEDEIGFLGKTLVSMSRSLKESFAKIAKQNEELEEYSKTLEQKVEERTRELRETQQQLLVQEKLASLGALTAGIAHEIKNPLNFVNNFATLSVELVEELRTDIDKQKSKLKSGDFENIDDLLENIKMNMTKISEHGKRADGIVRGMLQHSRGDSGEMQLTDIHAMLTEDINLAFHGLRAQDTTFNVTIEKNFDESIGKIKVNPQALSRVFLNIINNGLYAANEKAKKSPKNYAPVLAVSTTNGDDKIEIKIRDNGTGIPKKIVDKIFEPFFTTKPTGQGTGLGLSISYDIVVQMHKGELKVDTQEGEFTEFVIVLPKS